MNWFGKDNTEELEALRGENNRLKFRIEELERTVENLKQDLAKQYPLIETLEKKIDEQQGFITKYTIDTTSDPEKMAKHEAIDKAHNKKMKSKFKSKKGENEYE